MERKKISASAISTFLKSPRSYYWRYVAKLEPAMEGVATFSHDRLLGSIWSEAVERFYKGVPESKNLEQSLLDWKEQTSGWVPSKIADKYAAALENWLSTYYQQFHPKDGVRNGSEKYVENDRFHGYLDGLSHDGKIIHECKSTSRSPQIAEQLWKVQHSIQVKLYAVLTGAEGVIIEFAWKDAPFGIFRAPVMEITAEQREAWEQELNALHDMITALGDDINNYPCHPDGCCLVTKGYVGMCPYTTLCESGLTNDNAIMYKEKTNRRKQ